MKVLNTVSPKALQRADNSKQTFKGQQHNNFSATPADTFVKQVKLDNSSVTFQGVFGNSAKRKINKIPELKELVNQVVSGNYEKIEALEKCIAKARAENKLKKDDITPIISYLHEQLLKSSYEKITANKAISLVKMNCIPRIVVTRLNAHCRYNESFGDLIGGPKRKKAKKQLDQTRMVLNEILAIKDGDIRAKARTQIKETLMNALSGNVHSYVQEHAIDLLTDLNMMTEKRDINKFIRMIKSPNNGRLVRGTTINNLPPAVHQYIASNKEELDNDKITEVLVDCIKALQYIQKQERLSDRLKRAADASIKRMVTDEIVPKDIREKLVKALYGL